MNPLISFEPAKIRSAGRPSRDGDSLFWEIHCAARCRLVSL